MRHMSKFCFFHGIRAYQFVCPKESKNQFKESEPFGARCLSYVSRISFPEGIQRMKCHRLSYERKDSAGLGGQEKLVLRFLFRFSRFPSMVLHKPNIPRRRPVPCSSAGDTRKRVHPRIIASAFILFSFANKRLQNIDANALLGYH